MKTTTSMIHQKERILLFSTHLIFALALLLWFAPLTHPLCKALDVWTFQFLNGSLVANPLWQQFWGILNHRKETKFNLLLAALFNLWVILATKDKALRRLRIQQTLYFWVFFQLGFMMQDYFFNSWLKLVRASPSLAIQPTLRLSEVLQNNQIKDISEHSFPGGHAFAMFYWAAFTTWISPKRVVPIAVFFALLFSLGRLFSGAHWLSDVLFSGLLALIWFSWTLSLLVFLRRSQTRL